MFIIYDGIAHVMSILSVLTFIDYINLGKS